MSGRNDPSIREVAAGLSGVSLVLSSAQFWFGGREALSQLIQHFRNYSVVRR
jgi:hypothetical protein